jgi:hypothetical protein
MVVLRNQHLTRPYEYQNIPIQQFCPAHESATAALAQLPYMYCISDVRPEMSCIARGGKEGGKEGGREGGKEGGTIPI